MIDLKTARRMAMLEGRCPIPEQIVELVGTEYRKDIEAFFNALWFNYLKKGAAKKKDASDNKEIPKKKGTTSLVYWSDRFNNPTKFNQLLIHLSRSKWITTTVSPSRNWADVCINEDKLLEYLTVNQLQQVRVHKKFKQYVLEEKTTEVFNKTKTQTGIKDTGLVRKGFMNASNSKFSYDADMLEAYYDVIVQNLVKGMDKIRIKHPDMYRGIADYDEVSRQILDFHIVDNRSYTTGNNTNDSRGRAIKECLSKVFNPIGNKDARALIVLPVEKRQPITFKGTNAAYLAIAELLGHKAKSKLAKARFGLKAYANRTLLELDHSIEDDRSEVHVNIWLERLYNNLDICKADPKAPWVVPIEIDCTASMIMITGAILGDKNYLTLTNAIGNRLEDFWTVPGVPRKVMKRVGTPTGYGSSKSPKDLLDGAKMKYSLSELRIVTKEATEGRLALMNAFKDLIIQNAQPTAVMTPHIMDEEFTIACNRYRKVGDKHVDYMLYDSEHNELRTITHTHTHSVPDLDQFRRYFVTLLIHNLDSQLADKICLALDWVIDIHDAFIVHPNDAHVVRNHFGSLLEEIFTRRNEILSNYFTSINIPAHVIAKLWPALMKLITPVAEFVYNDMALK